jgi:DNA-binding transcriptional LysR family regulator
MAIFVKVVETGSFSEAARQLGSSPSAVSRSISRLEKALATRLLQRTTRKLRLSDGGEEVFKRCQEMVNAARSVMEISGQFTDEPEGVVRLSVPKAVGRIVIHPHIPEFLRRYPKVDVELLLEDRQVDLIDDHVDLAIRITDRPPAGLVTCLATVVFTWAKPRAMRAGSSRKAANLSPSACAGDTPPITRVYVLARCCSISVLAACRISRRVVPWRRG